MTVGVPAPVLGSHDRVSPEGPRDVSAQKVTESCQAIAAVIAKYEETDIKGRLQQTGEGTLVRTEAHGQLAARSRSLRQSIRDTEAGKRSNRSAYLVAADEVGQVP